MTLKQTHFFPPPFEDQCKGTMAQEISLAVLIVAHTQHHATGEQSWKQLAGGER